MASSNNILLSKMSGHIAQQLVIKQYGDKTIISKYPDMSRRKLSVKQKQVNKNMQKANSRAQAIMRDEKERNAAQLRLNVSSNKLYTSLIREYFQQAKAEQQSGKTSK